MAGRLENKVAIITGGCSGIGRDATALFIAEGAKVVVVCLRGKGEAMAADHPDSLAFLQADVRDPDTFERAVDLAKNRFGGLDIMYHNAGASGNLMPLADMTVGEWDDVMALLLRSSVFAIKHAVPALSERGGGSIILTGSVGATNLNFAGDLSLPAYTVAKFAVQQLARVAALELARHRIRVNTIIPGAIATSIFGSMSGASPEIADRMGPHIRRAFDKFQPWPKALEARDIAEGALYLASDHARCVTGIDLFVDGGLNLSWIQPADYLRGAMAEARAAAETEAATES